MAVLTAQGISRVAIALLIRRLALPRTATLIPGDEFSGSNGDTITVRVPQPGSARTQSSAGDALTADDVDEIPVDVTLNHLYHLKNVTDQEMSLDLENFARQITAVQVGAVAVGAEDELATAMNDLDVDGDIEFAASASTDDTSDVILAAREQLGENDAPPDNRFLAVAPDIATRVIKVLENRETANTDDALRDAIIGRLYGFTVVESNGLDAGTAVAYHRSGFCFATRTPRNPRGAAESAATTAQGISMRQVFQYQPSNARDQSLVSTFAGASAVWEDESATDNRRFIKIGTASA